LVVADESSRQLVQEITPSIGHAGMDASDLPSRLLPIFGAFLLAGMGMLGTRQVLFILQEIAFIGVSVTFDDVGSSLKACILLRKGKVSPVLETRGTSLRPRCAARRCEPHLHPTVLAVLIHRPETRPTPDIHRVMPRELHRPRLPRTGPCVPARWDTSVHG
jgi:hypothetical protein